MAKKDNTALWLIGAAAVAGYFLFKQGGALNPAQPGLNSLRQPVALNNANFQKIPGVADELPALPDIGIIAPALDPTGMQITLY
jgi:hypothetical protein